MTLPFRRRHDGWSSPHERARARAVERLDGPLEGDESAWLDRHLAECAACRSVSEAFEADRLELRALRRQTIEPPRDLWARTAVALEREAGMRRVRPPRARRRRLSPLPLGAVSGLMVVAVVFGAALLSGRPSPSVAPSATLPVIANLPTPTLTSSPEPTPWLANGEVDLLAMGDTGKILLYTEQISEVCPDNGAECAPLDPTPNTEVEVEAQPDKAIMGEDEGTLVVVDDGSVLVVNVPTPMPSGGPTGGPTHSPPTRSAEPSPTPTPAETAEPSVDPTAESTPSGAPASPPVESPSMAPPESPSITPPASPSVTPPIETTPTPGSDAPLEIADDVVLVGEPAFNEAGTLFAFSARPADGSAGSDIYVWRTDTAEATRITTDGQSVFGGWAGDLVLGSRPVDPDAPESNAHAFVIDPGSRAEAPVALGSAWRPKVDPTGTRVVFWAGTVERSENGTEWRPATGRLVIAPWPDTPDLDDPDPSTASSASPVSTPAERRLSDAPVPDWEARWDETGQYLGVWVADRDDPSIGRLSLYAPDERTGDLAAEPALDGEWAVRSFTIGDGSLAWATPPNTNGEGSQLKVVAWTKDGIGKVESNPGADILIVQR